MCLTNRFRGVVVAFAAAALTCFGAPALAEYPTKPIQIIIPYDAGGAADLQARIIAGVAPQYIGHAVIASNRTGAGGVTGSNFVVRSKPDGYTLLLARVGSQAGVPAINPSIPYKWNDYTFLGLLEKNPFVLVVNSKSDPQDLGRHREEAEGPGRSCLIRRGRRDLAAHRHGDGVEWDGR